MIGKISKIIPNYQTVKKTTKAFPFHRSSGGLLGIDFRVPTV